MLFDRDTKKIIKEDVYYKSLLSFLYKENFLSRIFLFLFSRFFFISRLLAFLNRLKISKYKILPFVKRFKINIEELEKPVSEYKSFREFFERKLKPNIRKIDNRENILIFPCDGRFLAYSDVSAFNSYSIKKKRIGTKNEFDLKELLLDEKLAYGYRDGSMLIARLAPSDYHRFHFPCDCIAKEPKLINGYLYSVNPIALRKNLRILSENKRMITILKTKDFSDILFIEIGATSVGSITQTFSKEKEYKKGDEKGFFSLGGSSIVLLFKKNSIKFDSDLIENSKNNIETLAKFGDGFASKI